MKVAFYTTDGVSDIRVGTIEIAGQGILCRPSSQLLRRIVRHRVFTRNGRPITSKNPRQFLAALPRYYKSAHLRAVLEK